MVSADDVDFYAPRLRCCPAPSTRGGVSSRPNPRLEGRHPDRSGDVVTVAVRFDLPGRYLYHCHIIEYEDTEVMRPFVVTVTDMAEGMGGRAPI